MAEELNVTPASNDVNPSPEEVTTPTFGKNLVESGEYEKDLIFYSNQLGYNRTDTFNALADLYAAKMKNSVNPADQAIYDMFPWKINERNQFDPTLPPPKDPNTGERLDYWYTGEDWIKTHLPLQESLLQSFGTEAALALGSAYPAIKAGTLAGSKPPGGPLAKTGVGVLAGGLTLLGADKALREGYEFLAENFSFLPQGITDEKARTPGARGAGVAGQYIAEMIPFMFAFNKIAKTADVNAIDFGSAYFKEKTDALFNPKFSADPKTFQNYYNLIQAETARTVINPALGGTYRVQKKVRSGAENITRELLKNYQNNPALFNGLEFFSGASAATAAGVVEYNMPDNMFASLGAEVAASTLAPGRMFGLAFTSAWPYVQAGTGLTVNAVFSPIETFGKITDKAADVASWYTERSQRKSTEAATEWLATAIKNNAETLQKEYNIDPARFKETTVLDDKGEPRIVSRAPTARELIDNLMGHFLNEPLVLPTKNGGEIVINTIDDIQGLGNFKDLTEPGTDAVLLTPFQKTHSELFGAIERLLTTEVGTPAQRAEFRSQRDRAHKDSMSVLGKLLITLSSQGNVDSLKAASKLQSDMLLDYLNGLIASRAETARRASAKLGFKDNVQIANNIETLRTELITLQNSLQDIAKDYYLKATKEAEERGGKPLTVLPQNTYDAILDLTDETSISDIPKFVPSKTKPVYVKVDPEDPDSDEILVDYEGTAQQNPKKKLGEILNTYNYIARQSRTMDVGEDGRVIQIGVNAETDPFIANKLRQEPSNSLEGGSVLDELELLEEVNVNGLINMRSNLLKEARKLMSGPDQDRVLAKQYGTVADAILEDITGLANGFNPIVKNAQGDLAPDDVAFEKWNALTAEDADGNPINSWQQDFIMANTLSRKIKDVFTRTFFQEFLQTKSTGEYAKSGEVLLQNLVQNFKGNALKGIAIERVVRERMNNLINPERITDPESVNFGEIKRPQENIPGVTGPLEPPPAVLFEAMEGEHTGVDFTSVENTFHHILRGVIASSAAKKDASGIVDVGSAVSRAQDIQPYTGSVTNVRNKDVNNLIVQMTGPSDLAVTMKAIDDVMASIPEDDVAFNLLRGIKEDLGQAGTAAFNLQVAEESLSRFNKLRESKTGIFQLTDDVTPLQFFNRLSSMQNRNVATKEFNQFVDFIAEISNPTGEGGGFPLADLNLDKIGKAMNQLGIPENELDNFLTDFKKFVDPDSGRVDTTLLKESAVDGILSGIFHQANVKSNNNKLNFTGESLKIFEEILTNPVAGVGKEGPSIIQTLINKDLMEPAHARNLLAILEKIQGLNLDPASLASITPNDPDLAFKILIARLSGATTGRKLADTIGTRATLQFAAIGSQFFKELVDITPTSKALPILFEMVKPGNNEMVVNLLKGARENITSPGTATRFSVDQMMKKTGNLYRKFLSAFFNPSVIATSLTTTAQEGLEQVVDPNLEEEMPAYRRYDPRLPENQLQRPDKEPVNVRPIERPLTMLPRPAIQPTQPQPRTMGPASPPTPDRMRFAGLFPEDITSGLIRQGAVNQGIGSLAG